MAQRGETGHTLRYRADTGEWTHDFIQNMGPGAQLFDHRFCYATALRIKNGRP